MKKLYRAPVHKGQYAAQLASQHGTGKRFEPAIEVWVVKDNKPIKAQLIMLRGSCDTYEYRYDYAEFIGEFHTTSTYLFPVKGYHKPALVELTDEFGMFHDWVSYPITHKRSQAK